VHPGTSEDIQLHKESIFAERGFGVLNHHSGEVRGYDFEIVAREWKNVTILCDIKQIGRMKVLNSAAQIRKRDNIY